MDIQQEKADLIEHFGVHFERLYHMPPLASRILGMLIVDGCRAGITFDEILERTQSSKSSVSTNINLLLKMGKITYFTVAGDRRKFFRPAPFSERLENYKQFLQFEKQLLERMVVYRGKNLTCQAENVDLKNTLAYQQHVLAVEKMLDKTIEQFKEIEKLNKTQ